MPSWLNRPVSTEMGDHWNKDELDQMLTPNQSLSGDELENWTNPWGGSYDKNDLYGNLDITPGFAGGAGEGASDAWQIPGASGKGGKTETTRLNNQCGSDGSGRVWSDVEQKCVERDQVKTRKQVNVFLM